MPTARAGGEFAIRMDDIDFENLAGGTVAASATVIRVTIPGGSVVEFVGNFQIDAAGVVAGGTLTGMREFFNGLLVYEVTGADVPASTFYRWVQDGDTFSALNAVFAGADTFIGSRFDDYLVGYGGNDTIDGGAGADYMDGGAGDDTYYVDNFNDNVFDPSGFDTIVFAFDFVVRSIGQIERYVMGSGVRYGEGSSFNEVIEGNSLDNQILGMAGNDTLRGFAGSDFLRGGSGNDIIDGGEGFDTASYSDSTVGVTVNLTLTGQQNTGFGLDQLISIEQLNGSNFADRLTGTSANETFLGLSGNDIISAGAGNDRLDGGAGSDRLEGGDGVDTAVYSGVRRQYGADSAAVRGGTEGGTDTLVSIEQLQFVDGILSFDVNGIPAQVMRLYDAALDRLPDQGGLDVQVQAITSGANTLAGLAQAFIASPEFQGRYGNLSDRAFVEQLYRFCLNRNGDEPGIQAQVQALQAGVSRGQLLINFSESAEHRILTQPTLNAGLWVPDAEALQIARLYDATFDRLPDAAGLASQLSALDGGVTLLQLAANFAASAEFQARYGNLSDRAFVEQLYRFCLDREGDEAGIQNQVQALQGGATRAQLLLNFSESAEHVLLTAPLWSGGIRTVDTPFSGSPDETAPKPAEGGAETLVLAEADSEAKPDTAEVAQVLPSQPADALYDPADLGLKPEEMDAFVMPALPDDALAWAPAQTLADLLEAALAQTPTRQPGLAHDTLFLGMAFDDGHDGMLHRIDRDDWM